NIMQNLHYFLAEAQELKNDIVTAIEHWEAIFSTNPKFKDVATKLETYADLRKSDNIKDYMTSSNQDFQTICQQITAKLELSVHEVKSTKSDMVVVIARESTKMVATKPLMKMVFYSRGTESISENFIRDSIEEMKRANCSLCIVISTSNFTTSAKDFSRTRPIQLIDAKGLNELYVKSPD
ncbi:MAG: restriction endonuclease, partial [Candidatus Margulisbacteria bacterium]|nr:restriction endonuclease [Candidatus Margulisiibacteriota bacterium]